MCIYTDPTRSAGQGMAEQMLRKDDGLTGCQRLYSLLPHTPLRIS